MWIHPRILAHRGGGKLAPENTLAALQCGLEHGFKAVEFDVMLARDGVPVVLHDPFLGRTVAGSGNVFDYDAAELALMDAGSWMSARYAGVTVPLFTQFVAFCRQHGIWMNIEIKPAPGFEERTGQVVASVTQSIFATEIARGDPAQLPLLSSFSTRALNAARHAAPALPRALLLERLDEAVEPWLDAAPHRTLDLTVDSMVDPKLASTLASRLDATLAPSLDATLAPTPAPTPDPKLDAMLDPTSSQHWQAAARALDVLALHTNHRHLSIAQAHAVKAAGFGLFCYTVNEPARARELFSWGVDSLCTDRIDLIKPDFA